MNLNLDIKAFAYPASNLSDAEPVSPCPCSLVFRCDDALMQATVLLVARIPTARDTEIPFVLQYDADKLMSSTARLTSSNGHVPRPQLDRVLRDKGNKRSDIKTLDFSIKHLCPLWCPETVPPFSPKPGHEPAFEQFVQLAKATTIHIVFDYKHLRKEHQGMFKAFSKAARGLIAYPIEAALIEQGLKKADWEVFALTEAAGAPPAYESSRSRSLSSPVQPLKRFAPRSPTGSHSSEKTIPFSPVAAEALGRALPGASPGFDYQTEFINAAIDRQLPAYFDRAQALQVEAINAAVAKQLPDYLAHALQTEAINVVVGNHLDKILPALLPGTLEILLAGDSGSNSDSSTPATSFTSLDSRGYKYPKLPPLTHVGRTMLPHLHAHLIDQFDLYQKQQLQRFEKLVDKTFYNVERSAYDDRVHERGEFETEMEEHKAEVSLLKRDTINELWRETEEAFAKGKEAGWALGDDINEQLYGLCDRIDRLKNMGLRKIVASEMSRQKRRKIEIPKGVGKTSVRAHNTLLGRQREMHEEEWVDI